MKATQFHSTGEIIAEAAGIAEHAGLTAFDPVAAEAHLAKPRRELYRDLDERLGGFVRSGMERIDEYADQFRLERRMSIARCLVLLAVPKERWQEPPREEYVSNLLDFFSRKVASAVCAARSPT